MENLQKTLDSILSELQNISSELIIIRKMFENIQYQGNGKNQNDKKEKLETLSVISKATNEINVKNNNDEILLTNYNYEENDYEYINDDIKDDKIRNIVTDEASAWLTSKGIQIKNYQSDGSVDKIFDQLSLYLGKKYNSLSGLYHTIKRNLSMNTDYVYYNVSNFTPTVISDITQFCTNMHRLAFFTNYNYSRNTKTINITLQRSGNVINFFTGSWFERYIYNNVCSLLNKSKLSYSSISNAQIILPNGQNFELDFLFIVENKPIWIECKTGNYQNYMSRYPLVRRLLNMPISNSFLVILDLSDDIAESLSRLYNITVVNQYNFFRKFVSLLNIEYDEIDVLANGTNENFITQQILSLNIYNIETLLKKKRLRPSKEIRYKVIKEVADELRDNNQPIKLTELRNTISLKTGYSRNRIEDILFALLKSGSFTDENGYIVETAITPVYKLINDDLVEIEENCQKIYIKAVLETYPDYFENELNVNNFEKVIGCKVDRSLIQAVKEEIKDI